MKYIKEEKLQITKIERKIKMPSQLIDPKSQEILNLQADLQKYRKFHRRSSAGFFGSTGIYLASVLAGAIYTGIHTPKNDRNAQASISRLESELNSSESIRSLPLPYDTKTADLENALQHYKTELSKTIEQIQNDIEKNKNDVEHKKYDEALRHANQYILPFNFIAGVSAGLSLISSIYFARKENKVSKELRKL